MASITVKEAVEGLKVRPFWEAHRTGYVGNEWPNDIIKANKFVITF